MPPAGTGGPGRHSNNIQETTTQQQHWLVKPSSSSSAKPSAKKRKRLPDTTPDDATPSDTTPSEPPSQTPKQKSKKQKKHSKSVDEPPSEEDLLSFHSLPWSEVKTDSGFLIADNAGPGGFFCLEELEGVDVEYEMGKGGGKVIKFKVLFLSFWN